MSAIFDSVVSSADRSAATEYAQSLVTNGTVIAGHLGVVQGYLVYKFITVNVENQTGYIALIDAGNGN